VLSLFSTTGGGATRPGRSNAAVISYHSTPAQTQPNETSVAGLHVSSNACISSEPALVTSSGSSASLGRRCPRAAESASAGLDELAQCRVELARPLELVEMADVLQRAQLRSRMIVGEQPVGGDRRRLVFLAGANLVRNSANSTRRRRRFPRHIELLSDSRTVFRESPYMTERTFRGSIKQALSLRRETDGRHGTNECRIAYNLRDRAGTARSSHETSTSNVTTRAGGIHVHHHACAER
jgi:hypothetical protein